MSRPSAVFRANPLAWLVGIAIAATVVAVALLAFGEDLTGGVTAGTGTHSDSAVGHRAAFEFLNDAGWPSSRNHDPRVPALRWTSALIVIEPEWDPGRPADAGVLPQLIAIAQRRGSVVLVVLPKWRASTAPIDRRYADHVSVIDTEAARSIAAAATGLEPKSLEFRTDEDHANYRAESAWGTAYQVSLFQARVLLKNPALTPLVTCDEGILVASLVRPDGLPVAILSDPDVINNQGLGKGDHAALLADLISHMPGVHELVFDEMIHGEIARGHSFAFAASASAFPVVLQLILLGAAVVWAFSGRFGTPTEPHRTRGGREVFIETTARLLEGSVGEGSSLSRYWRDALDAVMRARRIVPVGGAADLARLAAESSASGVADDPLSLAREIAAASEGEHFSENWITAAMKVHRWRREMMHGSRTTR